MKNTSKRYTFYFTATILEWKKLLKPDKYKDIIVNSLRFLVKEDRIVLYAFVIMINHIHLIWDIKSRKGPKAVQRDFLKYCAQKIKADLRAQHPDVLKHFFVGAKDRKYQFWERNPLSIPLWSDEVFLQKLNYLHMNPVRAGLCLKPEDYHYSSARFYKTGIDNWGFLTRLPF